MPLQKIVKVGLSGRAEEYAPKFAEKPAGMRGLSGEVGMKILSAGVGRERSRFLVWLGDAAACVGR